MRTLEEEIRQLRIPEKEKSNLAEKLEKEKVESEQKVVR